MRLLLTSSAVVAATVSLLALGACSSAQKRTVAVDKVVDAIIANDATAIALVDDGADCATSPNVGFAYCRKVEGDVAGQSVTFLGPPAQCGAQNEFCVYIKVYNQAGQLAWGGSIPKGQTRVSIPWSTLIGGNAFQLGSRGFWSFVEEVHWLDHDNYDRRSLAQGDIILRVYKKGYQPLNRVSSDPNFVWQWDDGKQVYQMTTGLRAFVGEKP